MRRTTLGILGIGIIAVLVVMVVILPLAGIGKTGPGDGTGHRFSCPVDQAGTGQPHGSPAGACLRKDCHPDGSSPGDGSGMQYGRTKTGCGNSRQHGPDGHGYGHRSAA